MEEQEFTVLENKTIGRNIALYRKIRGMKAFEVAEGLGLKEASYTRYERGEGAITVDLIQKVAEILKVDPLTLLSVSPGTIVDSANNSPNACVSNYGSYNFQTYDQKQSEMMLKLMENMMIISRKLIEILDKSKINRN
ncbi:MAG: helix-turn-helix domain-containing protein [Mangrovibacterium sp.]